MTSRTPTRTGSGAGALGLALTLVALTATAAAARVHRAAPGAAAAALAAAAPGDTVVLEAGIHRGALRVDRPLVLRGAPGAVIDGGGAGSLVTVTGGGAVIEDLALQGTGRDVMKVDAGVHVAAAERVRLNRLRITDVLYGVNAERATGLEVRDCRFTGRVTPLDESGEGNGIHLWHTSGALLAGNQVERFLDAIYLSFANDIHVEGNRLQWNGRYGLHTMYCQENRLVRNRFTLNVAGCALMFSNRLEVTHNEFVHNRGPRTYGLLLRDCSDGVFTGNRMADNTIAVFMDGSNRNRFRANLVEDNGWGLLVFASCANNEFSANHFIQNDYPVALDMRRTSNRFDDGARGNYWSENPGFDLDGDGIGDAPYAPVGAFAFVSKQYPDLTVLAKSPAVAALGVAERVFPAMRPSEAVDRFPLVRPSAEASAGAPAGIPGRDAAPHGGAIAGFATLALAGIAAMRRGTTRSASW
jgi:nitrous oxidase accessory protein